MAQCMEITDSGQVHLLQTPPEQCQALIVLQSSDYASLQTAENIWKTDTTTLGQAFGASFVLVLMCFVVSDAFGQFIRFIEEDRP